MIVAVICLPHLLPFTEPLSVGEILDLNISDHHIGENATIGCPISTCAQNITVRLFRGTTEINSDSLSPSTNGDDPLIYNFLLKVDENTPGDYKCVVDISGSNFMAVGTQEVSFQIAG